MILSSTSRATYGESTRLVAVEPPRLKAPISRESLFQFKEDFLMYKRNGDFYVWTCFDAGLIRLYGIHIPTLQELDQPFFDFRRGINCPEDLYKAVAEGEIDIMADEIERLRLSQRPGQGERAADAGTQLSGTAQAEYWSTEFRS